MGIYDPLRGTNFPPAIRDAIGGLPNCSLVEGEMDYSIYVETRGNLPQASVYFNYPKAEDELIGWGISGDYPDFGDVTINSTFFSPFSDVTVDVTDTNGTQDTEQTFCIADGKNIQYGDSEIEHFGSVVFHFPVRDNEGILSAIFSYQRNSSCKIKLFDISSRSFVLSSDISVVKPIHAVIDKLTSTLYVIDAYRIYGNKISYGGSLIKISLIDGTGIRTESIGGASLLHPRAVCLSRDKLFICDCGNHRIISVNRNTSSIDSHSVISHESMRFPFAIASSSDGRIAARAFYSRGLASSVFTFDSNGLFSEYRYDESSVGWDDICCGYYKSGLMVGDLGSVSMNGIKIIDSKMWPIQERLFVDTFPISMATSGMHGDSMAILDNNLVAGFTPEGKTNGIVSISNSSSGFIVPDHCGFSFKVIVPSQSFSMVYDLRNDIGTAMIKTMSISSIPVVASGALCLISSSETVVRSGNNLIKYSKEFNEVFNVDLDSEIIDILQDPKTSLILAFTLGYVHAIDQYTGEVYNSVEIDPAYIFTYSMKKSRLYTYDGEKIVRYTLFAIRFSENDVTFNIGHADETVFADIISMSVQENEDRLFAATENEVLLFDIYFNIIKRESGPWSKISCIYPFNYLSSIFRRDGFESPYTIKYTPSSEDGFLYSSAISGAITFLPNGYPGWTRKIVGFYTLGVDSDRDNVFVSCEDYEGRKYVVIFNNNGSVLSRRGMLLSGDVMIMESDQLSSDVSYNTSYPQFEGLMNNFSGAFTITDGKDLSIDSFVQKDIATVDPEFYFFGSGNSVSNKVVGVDSYQFERNGLEGTKISVNYSMSNEERIGDARRSPVFSWDFYGDPSVDVFAVGMLNKIVRLARGNRGYVVLDPIKSNGRISSVAVNRDRLAFTCLNVIYLHNLFDGSLITSSVIADDILVSSIDDDYLWAMSQSRAIVYKMPLLDIRRYDRIQMNDAPISIINGPTGKKIVSCENSMSLLSIDGLEIETIVNMEGYRVSDIDSFNDYLIYGAISYDDIPTKEETGVNYEYLLSSRRRDNLRFIDINTNKVMMFREYGQNERVSFCRFLDSKSLFIVYRSISGMLDKKINVEYYDITSQKSNVMSISTNSEPVSATVIPHDNSIVVSMRDGTMVYANSSGYIQVENPSVDKQSSSSSSSSSSSKGSSSSSSGESTSLIPDSYVEPEVLSAGSRYSCPHPLSVLLMHSSSTATSSSLSSTSGSLNDSSEINTYWYNKIQILVGHSISGSELWNSGVIQTSKSSILYGGGNNLQPGQRYYVSIRVGKDTLWTPYTTSKFIMSHFPGYDIESSSSSSSCICKNIYSGGEVAFDKPPMPEEEGDYSKCVIIKYSFPETGVVEIGGYQFIICENEGKPIWDCGTEKQHLFTYDGEKIVRAIDGAYFSITYSIGSIVLTLSRENSSSSSSSSSGVPYPDVFVGETTGYPIEDTLWILDPKTPGYPVDYIFDEEETT